MYFKVLAFDNNDEEDTTSLDAMSVSTGGVSRKTTGTTTTAVGTNGVHKSQSDTTVKLDEQLNDDLKNIDEKCNHSMILFHYF